MPGTPVEPVPAIQAGRTGVRTEPEVTAFAPQVLIRGFAPLPLRGIHPARPFNRRRGKARDSRRASPGNSRRQNRRSNRARGHRPANTLAYRLLHWHFPHNTYLQFPAKSQNLLRKATIRQGLRLTQNPQSTSQRYFLLPQRG